MLAAKNVQREDSQITGARNAMAYRIFPRLFDGLPYRQLVFLAGTRRFRTRERLRNGTAKDKHSNRTGLTLRVPDGRPIGVPEQTPWPISRLSKRSAKVVALSESIFHSTEVITRCAGQRFSLWLVNP